MWWAKFSNLKTYFPVFSVMASWAQSC